MRPALSEEVVFFGHWWYIMNYMNCSGAAECYPSVKNNPFSHSFLCFVLYFALFAGFGGGVYAQTASLMDEALSGGAVTYAQAAYFVLEAAGTDFGGSGDIGAAFAYAAERGWLRSNGSSADIRDTPIPLGELSFLVMKSFNLKGGYLYRLFREHRIPGSRYAYREMTYRGFITGITDPSRPVSGEKFFGILGKVLDSAELTGLDRE
jgi:hypothetical protein